MRTNHAPLVLFLGFAACEGEGDPEICGDLAIADGETVEVVVFGFDYIDYEGEDEAPSTEIVEDDTTWAALIQAAGVDPGIEPDFGTSAVWVHRWSDGGCEASFEYQAWRWGEVLRVDGYQAYNDGCDADFRAIDFILVELGGATDLGWCA